MKESFFYQNNLDGECKPLQPEKQGKKCFELSLITGVYNRVKFLGWKKNYIPSLVCAERRYEVSIYSYRQKRPKTRKRTSVITGIWCCSKCNVIFEIATQSGAERARLELHFYEHVCRLGKAKKECPKCTGTLSKYRVVGLH